MPGKTERVAEDWKRKGDDLLKLLDIVESGGGGGGGRVLLDNDTDKNVKS